MLTIDHFTCEGLSTHSVFDVSRPRFLFTLKAENNDELDVAQLSIGEWSQKVEAVEAIVYDGELTPFTRYEAILEVHSQSGEVARKTLTFETGFLQTPWKAKWISDGTFHFKEKKVSPTPMVFHRHLHFKKKVQSAKVYVTSMGIYDFYWGDERLSSHYFAPGFTSYAHQLMYQTFDVTEKIAPEQDLYFIVAGGWAVGSFVFTRKNRITANRQALLFQMQVTYEDGTREIITSDETWEVSRGGPYQEADFYDGEVFDARISLKDLSYHPVVIESLRISPTLLADYSCPVREIRRLQPVSIQKNNGQTIYDFGQNFAGVLSIHIKNATSGQKLTCFHAEVLNQDGSLCTSLLRSAKARISYTCKEGEQTYSPRFTYMGFRYASLEGMDASNVEVSALVLSSDIPMHGHFRCSNELLNRLQENILWGARSNFMDIPTDCPQRDERMGWTGDIALFSPTAAFNFDVHRFLKKWLKDVRSEQTRHGGIPNTIPSQSYGFPETMPVMAIDFWGDASILIPWALYQATGDGSILEENYAMMKKYVKACKFWANLWSIGPYRYIWHTPSIFHFGDWLAPDGVKMSHWQKRSIYTATASLYRCSHLLSQIASILGKKEDEESYGRLAKKVKHAYRKVLTDGNGKMKKEFQTAYVLPLHFSMFEGKEEENAAKHLVRLVTENDFCVGTGFPGTPYLLFALADHGCVKEAYRMLFQTKCPSWLYEVKCGATTIWERFDGLNEDGSIHLEEDGTGGMISYNHYASGSVGDFLYRRVAGIEPLSPGYRKFKINPLLTEQLDEVEASTYCPYGKIAMHYQISNQQYELEVTCPYGAMAEIHLPDGRIIEEKHGVHHFIVPISSFSTQK